MDLLRFAVCTAGCNREIVARLMENMLGPVDWYDVRLNRWAKRAIKAGDSKGEWLLELLKTHASNMDQLIEVFGGLEGRSVFARSIPVRRLDV
jgi:hypothetical protein